jgi:glycosyltransferase involved in cell wall biosynthesis
MTLKILVVELEPTHYKIDLWNAFVESAGADVTVAYSERKNWSPDGGHDYQLFPPARFQSVVLEGKGFAGACRSALRVLGIARTAAPELTYVAGYVHLQTILAIIYSVLTRRRFVVHADVFNNGCPLGRLAWLKWALRETLRKLVFRYAEAVLVCGRLGVETARAAGCPPEKIRDFPYSVSLSRIRADQPINIPKPCVDDLENGRTVILFSGRMIPRKGLPTLLQAMAQVSSGADWMLWIEGAGPELEGYIHQAAELGMGDRCRFLGFCQYDLHSWLVRSADIIIVPSFEDSWGIVVDEGLQLGKAVVSTRATGSAVDRILDGDNGFIIQAGDTAALAERLARLLNDRPLRERLGRSAASGSRNIRPEDNVVTLMEVTGKR